MVTRALQNLNDIHYSVYEQQQLEMLRLPLYAGFSCDISLVSDF